MYLSYLKNTADPQNVSGSSDHLSSYCIFHHLPCFRFHCPRPSTNSITIGVGSRFNLGNVQRIAEDLGFLTDGVRRLLYDSGFPGMKVIQFAFDSREESDYLPHNYEKNCVVYTGTHDNDTLCGWYKVLDPEDLKLSQKYMNNANTPKRQIHWDFRITYDAHLSPI